LVPPNKTIDKQSLTQLQPLNPNSLQLNVAIIAACAPSLKPLFTRLLGLGSTRDYYNNNTPGVRSGYGSRYGRGTRRGTRRLGDDDDDYGAVSGTRTGGNKKGGVDVDEFELEGSQQRTGIQGGEGDGSPGSTNTTFYKHSGEGSGSGSEERILGVNTPSHAVAVGSGRAEPGQVVGGGVRSPGILKTTEVQVFVK
jgi:hypothetical protein